MGDGTEHGDVGGGQVEDKVLPALCWLVTVNNPSQTVAERLLELAQNEAEYAVIADEVGSSNGLVHMHLAVKMKKPTRFSRFRSLFPGCNAKFTSVGLFPNFVGYCKKGDKWREFGCLKTRGLAAASRKKNLEAFRDAARRGCFSEIPESEYRSHYRYYQGLRKEAVVEVAEKEWESAVRSFWHEGRQKKQWQLAVLKAVEEPPDARTIIWVYDPDGGCGKSTFAGYLRVFKGAELLIPGKGADMAHDLEPGKALYVVDVPRTQGEYVPWGFVEQLKNGVIFKSKYESQRVFMKPPHVVIFSNALPPETTEKSGFSADRIHIINV